MDEIMTQFQNVGFPIAITFYLLFRIESKLNDLTNSIHELSNSIVNLNDNK